MPEPRSTSSHSKAVYVAPAVGQAQAGELDAGQRAGVGGGVAGVVEPERRRCRSPPRTTRAAAMALRRPPLLAIVGAGRAGERGGVADRDLVVAGRRSRWWCGTPELTDRTSTRSPPPQVRTSTLSSPSWSIVVGVRRLGDHSAEVIGRGCRRCCGRRRRPRGGWCRPRRGLSVPEPAVTWTVEPGGVAGGHDDEVVAAPARRRNAVRPAADRGGCRRARPARRRGRRPGRCCCRHRRSGGRLEDRRPSPGRAGSPPCRWRTRCPACDPGPCR